MTPASRLDSLRARALRRLDAIGRCAIQPHWEHYYWDEHPPPGPRWPWLRDAILATLIGVALGASVGFRLSRGYWPFAATVAVTAFLIHMAIMGVGQITEMTRLSLRHLALVTEIGLSATTFAAITVAIIA